MNFKSLNRFLLFGLALVATITFVGKSSFHFVSLKSTDLVITARFNSVHPDAPLDQPFELEDKEEQPETEDDESNESGQAGLTFDSGNLAPGCEISLSSDGSVISKSRTEHHAPAYVRFRTILI